MLAVSTDNKIRIYNVSDLTLIDTLIFPDHNGAFWVSFSKTETIIIAAGRNEITIYDA
jgi:hypothetical protein